jgi:Xaa-Pro dipeptidase
MILTLEPHIHIFGVCGTQFSDTILITETGRQYLTRFRAAPLQV